MLAARAIRKKKSKTEQEKKDLPRGPYIKPFGPRFDSSELPYFKYGVATQNCTLELELHIVHLTNTHPIILHPMNTDK